MLNQKQDPRPLTRNELSEFLPNQRAIKAFEKLFDLIPSSINNIESEISSESRIGRYLTGEITVQDNTVFLLRNAVEMDESVDLRIGVDSEVLYL